MEKIGFDAYLGLEPEQGFYLIKKIGEGGIGSVYKAEKSTQSQGLKDVLACKVIPEDKLKQGWERELQKVLLLRTVPHVVQYHRHGAGFDKNQRPYFWILWDYIPSINLRDYLTKKPWPLDIAFIENIVDTILLVLHACCSVKIQHGDLHEGNILISKPDSRLPGSPRTIWISDFGYGGSHNELEPRNDYRQLFSIASCMLKQLSPAELNPRDRVMYHKIDEFLNKKLLESDPTQGNYVGNPSSLLFDFENLANLANLESAAANRGEQLKEPGDYLAAEALGNRVEEWENLFVPEFLGAQDLLSKNISVLTGARGCGKTMAFRRLTLFMDTLIGKPSGVSGANQFVGFYLNCRDFVEAFPWLPSKLNIGMAHQILHYFHLAWFSEICKTLAICEEDNQTYDWLDGYIAGIYGNKYNSLPQGGNALNHARAFIESEKERCRLSDLGKTSGLDNWPFARLDFLDSIQLQIETHIKWISDKPIYLFLDDYTIPIITREVQRLLNPIIFKRRDKLFFKVSTEATNSFDRTGLRGKPLELHQDFELIDLATESLHQDISEKTCFLDKIFRPRIDRHPFFSKKNLGLVDVLKKMPLSNNQLAELMRKGKKKILYHGVEAFVGIWTSDIRIMIQMFTDMLREANETLKNGIIAIDKNIQDTVYRSAGGEFLIFMESVSNPSIQKIPKKLTRRYGAHLKDIVEAFVKVARYELTKCPLVSNQGRLNPKQAFRLEVIDKFEVSDTALNYFEGLIRWHVFLQDWRGKSVRGMLTPRLYLNRILLPYVYLTFSRHDNIQLTNEEFISMLKNPKDFVTYWERKRKKYLKRRGKDGEEPNLFDSPPKAKKK